jgi:hypothetical protein
MSSARRRGVAQKKTDQPHAKQITHALESTMWGKDAKRKPLSITCDGQRSLPDARRQIDGGTQGQQECLEAWPLLIRVACFTKVYPAVAEGGKERFAIDFCFHRPHNCGLGGHRLVRPASASCHRLPGGCAGRGIRPAVPALSSRAAARGNSTYRPDSAWRLRQVQHLYGHTLRVRFVSSAFLLTVQAAIFSKPKKSQRS